MTYKPSLIALCSAASGNLAYPPGYGLSHNFCKNDDGSVFFIRNQFPQNVIQSEWNFYIFIEKTLELNKAWSIIHDCLLSDDSGIIAFSVCNVSLWQAIKKAPNPHYAIMLHTFKTPDGTPYPAPEVSMQTLRYIESSLRKNDIKANPHAPRKLMCINSYYLALRNTQTPDGIEIPLQQALEAYDSINPYNQTNPYQGMVHKLPPLSSLSSTFPKEKTKETIQTPSSSPSSNSSSKRTIVL